MSRRRFLAGVGIVGTGALAAGFGAGFDTTTATASPAAASAKGVVDFHGPHQAGIATPAQDRLAFGSFVLAPGTTPSEVAAMLRNWTDAALKMTLGQQVGDSATLGQAPLDTGEALDSPPSRLTVTLGYGPSFFDDRLGLAAKKPAELVDLPALPNDALDPNYTGGDLCIQACSDDPQVAFHVIRNLARLGVGVVRLDWMEVGFSRTSTTSTVQSTPRNLLGFKDGTRNIDCNNRSLMDDSVWVGADSDQGWMGNGSYLVARRIRIFVEMWDQDHLVEQQSTIGRYKASGAPLTGQDEFDTPDFGAVGATGTTVIPANSHVHLAAFENNQGTRILRRGYSYSDGIDPVRHALQGGLFFIAFMKSPAQFIKLQSKLGANDALEEYISHVGSALFACPPGLAPGQQWGDNLFR